MSDVKYTDDMAEEIVKEIPEGVEESAIVEEAPKKTKKKYQAKKAIGKNVDVKCSSSNREASYDSNTGELVISQNGLVVMICPCRSEDHARKMAAKY